MATRTIVLPDDMYSKLKSLAEEKGLSVAAIIKIACSEYIEKEAKK